METENLLIEVEDKNGNSEVEIDIKTKEENNFAETIGTEIGIETETKEITNGKNGNHHHTGKNNNQD